MSAATASWADALPSPEHIENADGTITNISYKRSPKGKLIKMSQTIKKVVTEIEVDPRIAMRREWKRFGSEKNNTTLGPDSKTTQLDEAVNLVLGTSWKKQEEEEQQAKKKVLQATSTFKCRLCGGEHMTVKCPYKGTLSAEKKNVQASQQQAEAASATPSGKYVPPKRRPGATGASGADAEHLKTSLRVTNLNTSVTDDNLRELFSRYGRVERVLVLKDRDTKESRGIAFVDMASRRDAEEAMEAIDGKGFRSLIINVDWAKPKK